MTDAMGELTTQPRQQAPDISVGQTPALVVDNLRHHYGTRTALAGISLQVARGEMFSLLGPNGGGKTTLFHIVTTLIPPGEGKVHVLGYPLPQAANTVRPHIGVVFQYPSIDKKLTVRENLQHQGHLYGLSGRHLRTRIQQVGQHLGITERLGDLVETLSGGLQRRVELAKALLHEPALLLMDEPSTGLDPGARLDFTTYLEHLRNQEGVSILLTTHNLEEAERCDRVGILHQGSLVAVGTPDELKARVGGDVVVVNTAHPESLQQRIQERFGCAAAVVDSSVRIEIPNGLAFVRDVVEAFATDVQAVTFGKPTLADVFMHLTGHHFWDHSTLQEG